MKRIIFLISFLLILDVSTSNSKEKEKESLVVDIPEPDYRLSYSKNGTQIFIHKDVKIKEVKYEPYLEVASKIYRDLYYFYNVLHKDDTTLIKLKGYFELDGVYYKKAS